MHTLNNTNKCVSLNVLKLFSFKVKNMAYEEIPDKEKL